MCCLFKPIKYLKKVNLKVNKPLLSVITVCYNSEKTIKRTIESLLVQSFKGFEYIIIDGKSSDKTIEIIKSYEKEFKKNKICFKWISEKDKGIYDAFNKGIKLSEGNWISFLGSDDIYLPEALKKYKSVIIKSNKIELIYSNVDIVDEKGKKIDKINGVWSWDKFKRYMNIPHVGAFHNKEYFAEYGLYNISYKVAGDYELLLRAKAQLRTIKIEETTVLMANGGASNQQINVVFKETLKAKNKTAEINLLLCKIDYFIAFCKYYAKKILSEIIR